VALITDEGRLPYERPALTKELLRGETTERELSIKEEFWFWQEGVALICGCAMRLDPDAREIVLAGGRTLRYGHCVVATGAEPTRPAISGVDDPAVRVVRSLGDLSQLTRRLDPGDGVIVIGSGFIGCEIAASLRARGHPVDLVSGEPGPNRHRLGHHASSVIEAWLREAGVRLTLDAAVSAIERRDGELHVVAGQGRRQARVVVLATGVAPRGQILAGRDLISDEGAVTVDSSMRTPVPGLLAAGDVALAYNEAAGRALRVEHWGDALGQGQVAGETAAGTHAVWSDVPGFWSSIGDRTLKYAAWGDGYDTCRVERPNGDDAFAVWYGRDDTIVGVLTHNVDELYERGRELIGERARWVA
jgi:3-phenylpropionate/trans-cinnamate dioxygenase ferredoxin reductase subunit